MAPLYPLEIDKNQDLSDMKLFVSMGKQDPIVPMVENEKFLLLLKEMNIDVTVNWVKGHEITETVLNKVKEWFETL